MAEAKTAEQQQSGGTLEAGDFQSLLKKEFKPKTDRAREQVEAAVKTLAEQVLQDKDLIADDAVNSINAIIAEIDKKLTDQINAVLHHADFQQMEGTWRGLKHLVFNTESSETLKIKIFNVSKKELGKTLKRYPGTSWDQSPVFKKVYEEEYGTIGGDPFGCLVGDYYFDHSPQDVELLRGISQIAAAAHAPFISAAAPTLMGYGHLAGAQQSARPEQDLHHRGLRRVALAARVGRCPLRRAHHAALPVAPALWREDRARRGVRVRGGHLGRGFVQVHLVQRRLRDGDQHQQGVRDVWLVHAHPRRRVGRRGRRTAHATRSRPMTAAWT